MSVKFAYTSIQKLRARQRDKAAGDVQQIVLAIEKVTQQVDELSAEINTLTVQRTASLNGALSMNALLDSQRYQMQLVMQIQGLQEKNKILAGEKGRRDAVLLECQRNCKVLEKLEHQHNEQANAREATALQSRLDEWSMTRTVRDR